MDDAIDASVEVVAAGAMADGPVPSEGAAASMAAGAVGAAGSQRRLTQPLQARGWRRR
ncbi:MAG: hypothetical protein U0838_07620 [Chloroflexota bacterium]